MSSGAVSSGIVTMIETLASFTPQDVNAVPRDEIGDPPGAEFDASTFVKAIVPTRAASDCRLPRPIATAILIPIRSSPDFKLSV